MAETRNYYSPNFIERYKQLYCKYGVDVDCYQHLIKEFGRQYPTLTPKTLTLMRHKRVKEFKEARDAFLAEIKAKTGQADMEMLVEAKGLNSRLVKQMLKHQEDALDSMARLPISNANSNEHKNILSYCVQLQTQINKFSGVDASLRTMEFRRRLIDKRLVEESQDLDGIVNAIERSGDLSHKAEVALPEFIDEDSDDEI